MNESLSDMGLGVLAKTALEGPHGALAIAVMGILAAFGLYMSYTTGYSLDEDVRDEEVNL